MYSLDICITDQCNQYCPHCYVAPNSSMNELSTQQILDLLTECSELGAENFHIFGGEPFLREDLEEIFTYAFDLKYTLSIATNGSALAQKDFDWLQQTNAFLGINLFGPLEFHDSFCQRDGSYDKALTALKSALEMNLNVGAITCITKLNYELYVPWMQSLVAMGVRTFFVLYFSPLGRGKNRTDFQLTNVEWNNLYQTLQNYALNSNTALEIYFERSVIPKTFYYLYSHPRVPSCALFQKSNCVVDANGDIYPCILFLRNPQYLLGNFKINSLYEIWDRFQPGTRSKPEKCRKCEHNWICDSGCPAYFRDHMDFRCDPNYIPMCPLFSDKL